MGRDVDTIGQYDTASGISYVQYVRPSDDTLWRYRCKLSGDRVIWAGVDMDGPNSGPGRWRDDPRDSVVRYEAMPNHISISERFADGSIVRRTVELEKKR